MHQDLITQALKEIHLIQEKSLREVQDYLSLKYKIDLDHNVLTLRLKKLIQEDKAVA